MPPAKQTRSLAFRLVRGLLVAMAGAYLLVVCALWYWQAKFIFYPNTIVDTTPLNSGVKFEDVRLPLQGDQLAGWWVPAEEPHAGTLLYLHGSGGEPHRILCRSQRLSLALRFQTRGSRCQVSGTAAYGFIDEYPSHR